MPKLYDITNWNQQPWVSTGGTRSKKYVQCPDGKYYYFKKSLKKPGYEYPFEFWNEVIASELGRMLGFNTLQYDVAIDGDEIGCISESMISTDSEELVEGGKYLQAYENKFNPELKDTRGLYSLQLIEKTLHAYIVGRYMPDIIEIIIFDAIISNGDRHQENWAFIEEWIRNIGNEQISYSLIKNPSPIYDSGSSLARELSEERILTLLRNEQQFNAYVKRGTSEIHWESEKINHFEFATKLLESSYRDIVLKILERVNTLFNVNALEEMINVIDTELPEKFKKYKLSEARKRLIVKLITSRIGILKSLPNE